MKPVISPRDIERLSAHLDGQLEPAQAQALLARLEREPHLREALERLTQVRGLLRRAPQRKLPRNFMLSPQVAGQRQPSGLSAWSGFNFASALAALALLFVLVTDFSVNGLPSLPGATAEPMLMMAEAPQAESYAADATDSRLADEPTGGAAETLMLESGPANAVSEEPALKVAPSLTLAQWVALHARTLEILLASLAVIAGVFAWKRRRD